MCFFGQFLTFSLGLGALCKKYWSRSVYCKRIWSFLVTFQPHIFFMFSSKFVLFHQFFSSLLTPNGIFSSSYIQNRYQGCDLQLAKALIFFQGFVYVGVRHHHIVLLPFFSFCLSLLMAYSFAYKFDSWRNSISKYTDLARDEAIFWTILLNDEYDKYLNGLF